MDLRPGRRIVVPDDLLLRRNFIDLMLPRRQNVAIAQHPNIVDLSAIAKTIGPHHLAVIDHEYLVIALPDVKKRMLRESASGYVGSCGRFGPFVWDRRRFVRTLSRNVGRRELLEDFKHPGLRCSP